MGHANARSRIARPNKNLTMGDQQEDLESQLQSVDVAAESRKQNIAEATQVKEDMEIIKELSTDMNEQVKADQENLDKIDENVDHAKTSIEQGNDHLVHAVEAKKARNKTICSSIVVGIVMAGVIALVLYLTLK